MSSEAKTGTLWVWWTKKLCGYVASAESVCIAPGSVDYDLVKLFHDSHADKMIYGSLKLCMFDELERLPQISDPLPCEPSLATLLELQNLMNDHPDYSTGDWAVELWKDGVDKPIVHVNDIELRYPDRERRAKAAQINQS